MSMMKKREHLTVIDMGIEIEEVLVKRSGKKENFSFRPRNKVFFGKQNFDP